MSQKIKPALTAEEWEFVYLWARGKLLGGPRYLIDGMEAWGPDEEHRMAIAAHALHGRITWEMVDALRDIADGDENEAREGAPNMGPENRTVLRRIADLLEELLPPRP